MRIKGRYIILLLCILLLSGCTNDVMTEDTYTNVTEVTEKDSLEETMKTLILDEFNR